jgi:GT2 family glycosyltransferase
MERNKQIAVLFTCFNRKVKTINSLTALYNCELPNDFMFNVFLVDDGSTDGTSQMIMNSFPEVIIIQGNGNLYWNRGMYTAWSNAEEKGRYDYFLWLNDDTLLYKNSLLELVSSAQSLNNNAIICGSTLDTRTNKLSYGGKLMNNEYIIPNGVLTKCDFFNGNIVLIPNEVYIKTGKNDFRFHHALGDFDYGLRAKKDGFKSYIAPSYCGECDAHDSYAGWCNPSTPLIKRFNLLYSPLGNHPVESFIFERRHNGILHAFLHFLTNHLRAFLPQLWNNRKNRF